MHASLVSLVLYLLKSNQLSFFTTEYTWYKFIIKAIQIKASLTKYIEMTVLLKYFVLCKNICFMKVLYIT